MRRFVLYLTSLPQAIGSIQIEVYNACEKTVEFNIRGYTQTLDLYKTPRQLGLRSGSSLRMVETVEYALYNRFVLSL